MKRCEDITRLHEQSKEEKLSFMDRVTVKIHMFICKLCKNFSKDSECIDGLLKNSLKDREYKLTPDEKSKISKALSKD